MMCVICMLGPAAGPALFTAGAEEPPGSPDLFIIIADIEPLYNQTCSTAVWSAVNITAAIFFFTGTGVIQGNVTFYANGTPLGSSPVVDYLVADIGRPGAWFLWDTGSLRPGNYTIRAELNASGDANLSMSFEERNFTLGAGPPALTVAFERDTFIAEPSRMTFPEERRTSVGCNYTVRASNLAGRLLIATINASLDNGWEPFVGVRYIYISSEGPYTGSVHVAIPPGARADRPGNLTLTADATEGNFDIYAVASARIALGGDWRMQLDSSVPYLEIAPGEPAVFTVGLTNIGNAEDSFSLEIENQNDLSEQHASAVLSCRTLKNVGPGETKTFRVTFQGPRDWTLWKSEPTVVLVRATSLGAQAANRTVTFIFSVYAYEKGTFPAWYIAYPAAAGAMALLFAPWIALALWIRKRKRAG